MLKPAVQPIEKRLKNFDEVILGMSKKDVLEEARRFPQRSDPSQQPQCRLGIDIPGFIRILREGNVIEALKRIKEEDELPSISGRVCPQPRLPQEAIGSSTLSFDIRSLQRYAADHGKKGFLSRKRISRSGRKIAVIGSGISGLTLASRLVKMDYRVTVFEGMPEIGGRLRYIIPNFRLPKNILDAEIAEIKLLGVEFVVNSLFGQNFTLEELKAQGFEAVVLAMGSSGTRFMELDGSNLSGVYYAEELLIPVNLYKPQNLKTTHLFLGQKVTILGSTQKAVDCARICRRLGRDVSIVFEGTEEEFDVEPSEVTFAKEEGIGLVGQTKLLEVLGNEQGVVKSLNCQTLDFADPESDGNWRLMAVPESDHEIATDSVIVATPDCTNQYLKKLIKDINLNNDGSVFVDEHSMTNIDGVFATGHLVLPHGQVDEIMSSGKLVAENINHYLQCHKEKP